MQLVVLQDGGQEVPVLLLGLRQAVDVVERVEDEANSGRGYLVIREMESVTAEIIGIIITIIITI